MPRNGHSGTGGWETSNYIKQENGQQSEVIDDWHISCVSWCQRETSLGFFFFDEVKYFCDWPWWILHVSIDYTKTWTVGTEEVKCI